LNVLTVSLATRRPMCRKREQKINFTGGGNGKYNHQRRQKMSEWEGTRTIRHAVARLKEGCDLKADKGGRLKSVGFEEGRNADVPLEGRRLQNGAKR